MARYYPSRNSRKKKPRLVKIQKKRKESKVIPSFPQKVTRAEEDAFFGREEDNESD